MRVKITTDPQDELLTEVDQNNKVIGHIKRRVAHKSPNKFYRTISVFVKNNKNEFLWQKRSQTKDTYPNCWDYSVGGHVDFGKSYRQTAIRELKEELGIITTTKKLKFIGKVLVRLPKSNEFFYVFEYSLKLQDKVKIEKDEVSKIMWASIESIKKSIKYKELLWYPRPIQIIKALF